VRQIGCRVRTASDAQAAQAILSSDHVDILIADIHLPDASGLDLITAVRQSQPNVVRIILSGAEDRDAVIRAINQGGVFRYLAKPATPEALRATLQLALAAGVSSETLTAPVEPRDPQMHRLEQKYPGFRDVERDDDGAYVIRSDRVAVIRDRMKDTPLRLCPGLMYSLQGTLDGQS